MFEDEECEKCGSYNTYIEEDVPYSLFSTCTKKTCADCGHVEYLEIAEKHYD